VGNIAAVPTRIVTGLIYFRLCMNATADWSKNMLQPRFITFAPGIVMKQLFIALHCKLLIVKSKRQLSSRKANETTHRCSCIPAEFSCALTATGNDHLAGCDLSQTRSLKPWIIHAAEVKRDARSLRHDGMVQQADPPKVTIPQCETNKRRHGRCSKFLSHLSETAPGWTPNKHQVEWN